jgi:putative membrane protein
MKSKNFNFFLVNLFFAAVVIFFILILWQGKWIQGFFITALLTLAIFLFTLWHSFEKFGARNSIIFLLLATLVSFGLEFVGTNLANNFNGYYKYSEFLGLQIANIPILVILMWTAVIYIAHQVSEHITNFRFTGATTFLQKFWISAWCALLTSLIAVSWDFALEPLAKDLGWWTWLKQGEYFGVPLQNFIGWIVISFVVVFIYKLFFEKEKLERETNFNYAPVVSYTLLCAWTIFMALNLGRPMVAFIAFSAMFPYISIMIIRFLVTQLNFPEQYKK